VHYLYQLTELVSKLTVSSFTVLVCTVLALTVSSYLMLSFAVSIFSVLSLSVLSSQQRSASRSTIFYDYHSHHFSSISQKYSVQYCFYQSYFYQSQSRHVEMIQNLQRVIQHNWQINQEFRRRVYFENALIKKLRLRTLMNEMNRQFYSKWKQQKYMIKTLIRRFMNIFIFSRLSQHCHRLRWFI